MADKILILGHTGKLGQALARAFASDYRVAGAGSRDFDAAEVSTLPPLLRRHRPDLVINAVVFGGMEECESDPQRAFAVNTLMPRALAELAGEQDFTLVQISSDAVFADLEGPGPYTESSAPRPLNVYGLSKLGADCLVAALAPRHYICRIPILFGPPGRKLQFVEKMIALARQGAGELRISADVEFSPSYSRDVARALRELVESGRPHGLYHLANQGRISLLELMQEIMDRLGLSPRLVPVLQQSFPSRAVRCRRAPLGSEKLEPLRPWREAVADYCRLVLESGE